MTQEEIDDIFLVGKFMGVENLFPFKLKLGEIVGVYITDKEPTISYASLNDLKGVYISDDSSIHYEKDIKWYAPHDDWNELMKVCKKIINMYFDRRTDIYKGLDTCDIDATYKAVVEFIKFWNDDTQVKTVWNSSPEHAVKIMKVTDTKELSADKRNRVSGGTYITFISNDAISKGAYVDIVVENKTHHFEVADVKIIGKYLSVDAREVGYWARKIEKKDNFDLRTLLGLEIVIVTDDKEKKQIYTESCWC